MIYSFIYGLYITLLTFVAGFLLQRLLSRLWNWNNDRSPQPPSFLQLLFLGLVSLSAFAALVSVFGPVTFYAHLFLVLMAAGGAIILRREIRGRLYHFYQKCREHKYIALAVGFVYLASISRAAGLITIVDTGYYHIPLVKWLNEYGLVPGLANLQDTLGFMSGWFYYASLFDFGMFDNLIFHVLNALAFTWGWGFVAVMAARFKNKVFHAEDFLVVPLTLYLVTKGHFIASLSPQIILSVLLFWIIYRAITATRVHRPSEFQLGIILLAAAYAVFLKPSAAPVILLLPVPLYRYLHNRGPDPAGTMTRIFKITAPALLLLGYLFYQNVILTGYLLFPFTTIDLFNPGWKVPEGDVQLLLTHIKNFGINPFYTHDLTGRFFTLSWFPEWLSVNFNFPKRIVTMVCFVLLPVSFGFAQYILFRMRARPGAVGWLKAVHLALVGILASWFLTNPNPRFGEVWILTTFFFPLSMVLMFNRHSLMARLRGATLLYLLAAGIWFYFFAEKAQLVSRTFGENSYMITWISPLHTPDYEQISIADGTMINVFTYNEQPNHWDIPLPGTGQEINYKGHVDTRIVRRDTASLAGGFKPAN